MKRRKIIAAVFSFGLLAAGLGVAGKLHSQSAKEAPSGYSTPTLTDNPGSQSVSNGMPQPANDTFADDQATFEEEDGVDKGLGPIYNARSCSECHQNPVTGGTSQVAELRVGHNNNAGKFVNPSIQINDGAVTVPNRSLVNDRSTCAQAQERVPSTENIHTFRMSLNTLGDGFVEAIPDSTLMALAAQENAMSNGRIHGEAIQVPIAEAPGKTAIGKFGWKDQHASLLSFSGDAYVNEQGITSRLDLTDSTQLCKTTTDPEDVPDGPANMADIDHFAQFMRGTLAPPVDATLLATADAQNGKQIFNQVGCAMCHTPAIMTAATGAVIDGGTLTVPDALGSKIIHPYSDFLLHNVGTGDGIVQNGPADTAQKLRTPPLWGLRTRDRLMHDGLSSTRENAIARHGNEAASVINNYNRLSARQKSQLLTFLNSL
ncbi:MAG TPA: di-heme oxidoredictase family protein [Terriglobales bacterium]